MIFERQPRIDGDTEEFNCFCRPYFLILNRECGVVPLLDVGDKFRLSSPLLIPGHGTITNRTLPSLSLPLSLVSHSITLSLSYSLSLSLSLILPINMWDLTLGTPNKANVINFSLKILVPHLI